MATSDEIRRLACAAHGGPVRQLSDATDIIVRAREQIQRARDMYDHQMSAYKTQVYTAVTRVVEGMGTEAAVYVGTPQLDQEHHAVTVSVIFQPDKWRPSVTGALESCGLYGPTMHKSSEEVVLSYVIKID